MKKLILISFIFLGCNSDQAHNDRLFKKEQFGSAWPFSVNEIEVYCTGLNGNEVYFIAEGKKYALNGKAQQAAESRKSGETFDTFKAIWKDDSLHPNTKIPIPGEFVEAAMKHCE